MKTDSEKLAAASDPSTPADTLAALAVTTDEAIRQALAANPNTPEDLLRRLWEDHPACLLANPILTLWEFSRANSVPDLVGDKVLLRLYNHLRATGAELPAHIFLPDSLRRMIRSGVSRQDPGVFAFAPFEKKTAIRIELLDSPARRGLFIFFQEHAPDAVWMRFAADPVPELRVAFAELLRSGPYDAKTPRPILAEAARLLFQDGLPEVLSHLANCRVIPPDLVERLAESPDVETREALARCVLAEIPTLQRLAADPAIPVRLSLARNCEREEIHRNLVRDPAADVRRQLAQNQTVSLAVLGLFDSKDLPEVLRAVFQARHADSNLRARLLREAHPAIQNAVLQMGSAYTPAFHRANKSSLTVETLAGLAESPRLPRSIVEEFARAPEPQVRLGVARRLGNSHNRVSSPANLALLELLARDPHPAVRLQICTDPRLGKESTAALFRDRDPVIRKKCVRAMLEALESRRSCRKLESYRCIYEEKAALVTDLSRDPDHAVRFAIASSSETPPAAKAALFDDPEAFIRDACREHTQWPYGVLLDLEKRLGPQADELHLRHGITTPAPDALRILAKSRNPFERLLTARCRRTPKAELQHLARDPHPAIREAALSRLQKN
jgi:hypothetical protein